MLSDVVDWFQGLTYGEWILILGSIGQTLFVVLWAPLPWYREWIGRAVMVKAVSILLLFDVSLVYWIWPGLASPHLYHFVTGLIVVGIWSQLAALLWEHRRARRESRTVIGTHT